MNRGVRNNQSTANNDNNTSPTGGGSRKKESRLAFFEKISGVGFILLVTLLALIVILSMVFLKETSNESKLVENNKYQAVFLNGGQVYFGKIDDLNSKRIDMSSIYYLRVNQQVQPNQSNASNNDISLVKLGCELHGPTDKMVINREQVIFWENLKDDGQVAKAIAEYKKQYPSGQKCDQQNNTQTNNTNIESNSANT
ncbi:MAG TPA: hypothetical protein PK833_14505, partial [Vicingus sp.]|nr:hypothetical protein [Vicingus sp.]